ncbi:hypothetical protein [Oribacterium asaccharolyticum]|uniref:hypothetical protein n=1 Tax=Oribacterium asaccharolyticum TaxID=1501332 RepID=UPI0028E28FA7|nr:hypothetical protein [Oribacterium asaccharolyticum]
MSTKKHRVLWECECQAGIEKARSANDSVNTIISLVKNITITAPEKGGKEKGGKNYAA